MLTLVSALMSFENLFRVVLQEAVQAQKRKCMLRRIGPPMADCFYGRVFLSQKTFYIIGKLQQQQQDIPGET